MPFSRFMHLALYHPQLGYYCRPRDPFGKSGDFYTAEQFQPVFGRLIAAYLRQLAGAGDTVVEVGAGRGEMGDALAGFRYIPVDMWTGELPPRFHGVIFSNELFDAIPVDLLIRRDGAVYERRVSLRGDSFAWDDSVACDQWMDERVEIAETQHHRIAMLRRLAQSLERGFIVTIDYGFTRRELIRFPEGSLMSYRRHTASSDVLNRPGEQDITAHVDWTALEEQGVPLGLRTERFETLAAALLHAGEPDGFAAALAGATDEEEKRHRMQLKTLLFGMGETFRVLVQRKEQ